MDIIIFSGQSNMQGQSERLSSSKAVPNAYEYRWLSDSVVPLCNPVGENITKDREKGYQFVSGTHTGKWLAHHVLGSACYGHTNLVPSFCESYTRITGREALAVHAAKGSTAIAQWMPGTDCYSAMTEKSLAAIKKAGHVEHIYFVWLQGESDAIAGNSKAYYIEKIIALNEALRKDIGIERFGIIRVGRFMNDTRDDEIISAQDEVCLANDGFLMLTDIATTLNKQPIYMHPEIAGHYSALGLERLGTVAGEALGKNQI